MRRVLYARLLKSHQQTFNRAKIIATGVPATHRNGYEEAAAMIKKVKGGYKVLSSKGRNMGGPYKTREEALKRLRQVEFFKHRKG
jgi:hypothetical protein